MPVQGKLLRAMGAGVRSARRDREREGGRPARRRDQPRIRQAVARRRFREDLCFRFSPVTVPALRERPEDIPLLARHFVARKCGELGRRRSRCIARSRHRTYRWPGNVRELQNSLERAVILSDGDTIQPGHLSLAGNAVSSTPAANPWDAINLDGTLAEAAARVLSEAERRKILRAIREAGGDRGRAADLLQVGYKALLAKMKDFGLDGV